MTVSSRLRRCLQNYEKPSAKAGLSENTGATPQIAGAMSLAPSHRAVDLLEALFSEAIRLSRIASRPPSAARRRRVLDSLIASEVSASKRSTAQPDRLSRDYSPATGRLAGRVRARQFLIVEPGLRQRRVFAEL